jgi:trans-aconitate methyltransferase
MKPGFDQFANNYVRLSNHPIKRMLGMAESNLPYLQLKAVHLETVLRKIRSSPSRILDFGCGDGQFGVLLQTLFPNSHHIGVDCSIEMMRQSTMNRNFVQVEESRGLPIAARVFD